MSEADTISIKVSIMYTYETENTLLSADLAWMRLLTQLLSSIV